VDLQVLFGLDYTADDQQHQLAKVRERVVDHLQTAPEGLLVIEEYDKLSCEARAMLRQVIQYPHLVNVTTRR
jgi:hypothetical protein